MAASTTPRGRLRRLAELRPQQGRVLSVYLDLDPAEFATGAARATQLNATLDEAAKLIEAAEDLDHAERDGLRSDVERIRRLFDPQSMGAGGVRGIAVFACEPADLLEVVRVGHPVETRVIIGESPHIEPLASAGDRERWCVVLVNARHGRILLGNEDGLEEVEDVVDETKGQHDQGGWSQRRYEESIENERRDHLEHVAERMLKILRRSPFDRLLVGGPDPVPAQFEERLHPYLSERLAGRVQIDVENTSAADVLASAAPIFQERRREREREAVERLRAGLGRPGGRAVAGLPDVLAALNEQRVEVLLLEPNRSARGWVDPETGYLAAEPGPSPTDGALQEREDVLETAIERAVEQSAEVLVLQDQPDLGPHGGVAALLRF